MAKCWRVQLKTEIQKVQLSLRDQDLCPIALFPLEWLPRLHSFLDDYSLLTSLLLSLPSLISTSVAGPQPLSPQGLPALLPKEQAVHSQPSETGWPPVQRLPNVQRQWLVKSCSHGFPFLLTPISTLSTALPHLPSICFQATGSQQIPKSDFPAPESITAITQPALAPVLPSIPPPTSVTDVLSYLTKDSEQDLEFPLL